MNATCPARPRADEWDMRPAVMDLMTVSAPDGPVAGLAEYRASNPDCGIAGRHIYPFGGLRRSAPWACGAADGAIALDRDARGFRVEVDY